ncbi:MAG: hypothetical protein RLZZ555_226 [Pseudomonadota bacterium]|jgi:transcriptional regulator with XRE-family HTH domain
MGTYQAAIATRSNRYETGVHEPAFEIARKLAQVLGVTVTYFYCEDGWLANLLLRLSALTPAQRERLDAWLSNAGQADCLT